MSSINEREYTIRTEDGKYYLKVNRTGEECEISEKLLNELDRMDREEKRRESRIAAYEVPLEGSQAEDETEDAEDMEPTWAGYDDPGIRNIMLSETMSYVRRKLPGTYRKLFRLMNDEKLKPRQLCAEMNISYETLRKQLVRMRRLAREIARKSPFIEYL